MNSNEIIRKIRQFQLDNGLHKTVHCFNRADNESFELTITNVRFNEDDESYKADVLVYKGKVYTGDELFVGWNPMSLGSDGQPYRRAALYQRDVKGPIATFPGRHLEELHTAQDAAREHGQVELESAEAASQALREPSTDYAETLPIEEPAEEPLF